MTAILVFPPGSPEVSPSEMWSIQNTLLAEAERLLGPKDPTKEIYQPTFSDKGPHTINTPSLDGAFADLSPNAARFWPTAVYELAHETVHLLNPIAGAATVLEEGVAETFALQMGETFGGFKQSSRECYQQACDAVSALGSDVLEIGKMVREKYGSLSRVKASDLKDLFPTAASDLIEKLVAKFDRK